MRHEICRRVAFLNQIPDAAQEGNAYGKSQAITYLGLVLVVLETADAIQPLQIHPAFPPHAHSIHYEVRSQVNLRKQQDEVLQLEEMDSIIAHGNTI
jgi:hypothetical protein